MDLQHQVGLHFAEQVLFFLFLAQRLRFDEGQLANEHDLGVGHQLALRRGLRAVLQAHAQLDVAHLTRRGEGHHPARTLVAQRLEDHLRLGRRLLHRHAARQRDTQLLGQRRTRRKAGQRNALELQRRGALQLEAAAGQSQQRRRLQQSAAQAGRLRRRHSPAVRARRRSSSARGLRRTWRSPGWRCAAASMAERSLPHRRARRRASCR